MKKKFTLLIAVLMAWIGFSASADVGDIFSSGGIRYKVIAEGDVNEVEFCAPASGYYTVTANSFSETVSNGTTTYTIVGIGEGAFRNAQFPTAQGTFNFPRTIRYVADYAFEGLKGGNNGGGSDRGMRNVRIYDDALQTIAKTAFINNQLKGSFYIGNTVDGGFRNLQHVCSQGSREANMSSVCYENTLLGLGNQCTNANSSNAIILKTITLNSEVKTVGENAMYGNSTFTTINLNEVEGVESHAFKNCVFTTVTIPATCTTIASDAFEGCTAISTLTCNAATPPAGVVFEDAVYESIRTSGNITVPAASLEAYQADANWRNFWFEPAPAVERVHIAESEHGAVAADNLNPADGATVTLTVTPEAGYELTNINVEAVIDPGNAQAPRRVDGPGVGVNVTLTPVVEGQTYTFEMPAAPYEVLVTSEFALAEYDITVAEGIENGTVVADKETAVYGEAVTVTVTPDTGYELASLTYIVEGAEPVAIENGTFNMPAADVTINATFTAVDYTITVAEGIENGTVTAPATANYGETVNVAVTPATGYEVATLTYTVQGEEPVTIENNQFVMPAANVTINATFTAVDYTITVAEGIENGTVAADKVTANVGETVTVTATPDTGYELTSLTYTVEGAEPVAIENNTFNMPAANVTINATFTAIDYTITVAEGIENGTVAADKETANYGDAVTVTVTPAEGYEVASLTYTVEGEEPVAIENGTFNMPAANVTINATFSAIDYTITVADDIENGTVVSDKETANVGETVTLTVTPAEGYSLGSLTVMNGETSVETTLNQETGEYTFVMPAANVTVTATFTDVDYTITVAEGIENGTVTAPETANFGETVNVTVTPDTGYELATLTYTVEGEEPVAIENNQFNMPAANVTINATFAMVDYTITVADGIENGTVTAPETANYGETVNVTVAPATGYELASLTYTVEGEEPVAIENNQFEMPAADVTINATFTAVDYTIIVADGIENGTVTAPETANYGETVNVTVTPDTGYQIATLTYTVEGGEPVDIENNQFVMPAANVTIDATFELIPVVLDGVVFAGNTYATWYGNADLALPEGVTAYVVTNISDDKTQIEPVDYIPANVGVLLYSTVSAESVSTVPYMGETVEVTSMLQGSVEDMEITDGYVLYDDTFVRIKSGTLAAHRCYLPVADSAGAPMRLTIVRNNDVITAVDDINVANGAVRYIDVNGRVSDKPFNGINIVVKADGSVTKMVK